jgi:hypothetical protein
LIVSSDGLRSLLIGEAEKGSCALILRRVALIQRGEGECAVAADNLIGRSADLRPNQVLPASTFMIAANLRISPTSLLAFATAHQIWRYHRLGEAGDHSWMRPASGPRDFAAFRGQITYQLFTWN